jgi:hypothetical protein
MCLIWKGMSLFAFMSIFSFHYHQQYFYWTWQLVTRWVHHKKQDLITLREYIGFNPVLFGGVRVAHLFVCCVVSICFYFICLCYVSCAQCCSCVWIVHSWLLLRVSIFIYTVFISDTSRSHPFISRSSLIYPFQSLGHYHYVYITELSDVFIGLCDLDVSDMKTV